MSEIRVDTISEKTSANGVAIDSVTLKDGQVDLADSKKILIGNSDDLQLYHDGTDSIINNATGTLKVQADSVRFQNAAGNETIFGGTADGAAFLVHDDATKITTTSSGVTVTDGILVSGTTPTVTVGDGGAEDAKILFDGNAQNFHIGLDDSTDKLTIGLGNALGTYPAITIDENTNVVIPDSSLSVIGSGNYDLLTVTSTDADANSGPVVVLNRDSGSPADNDACGLIKFKADDDGGNSTEIVNLSASFKDVSNGAESGEFNITTILSGSQMNRFKTNAAETVLNDDSGDIDFRVESNGQANMLFVDGGNNRVHINGTTGTREFNVSGDNTRLLLYSTNNSTGAGQLQFGDADDEQIGRIMYEHDGNKMTFHTAATERMRIHGGGEISTGGEAAPDVSAGGLCLNQGANDTNAFSLKSSDVAHGVTDLEQTDTWFSLRKFGANDGGVQLRSMAGASSNCALFIDTVAGSEDTGKGTGDHGCTNIDAQKDNGTDKQALASNGNLLTVSNDGAVRFIVDAEGDIHVDGSSSISTYDTYEDAQLVRAYDLSYGQTSKGLINSKFDKFINYNHDSLVEAGIIGVPNKKENEDGTEAYGLLNSTAMQRLHNGAIWQQYEKHQRLASAFYKLAEKTIGKEEADKLLTEEEIQLLN